MFSRTRIRTAMLSLGAAAVVAGVAMAVPASASSAPEAKPVAKGPKPTVVLVHGAFADATGFSTVITKLTRDGYPVRTVSNPLRGLATDTAAAKDVLNDVKGPIVLVGHSYGGAVISNAAAGNPHVKALVYLAALAPDKGEAIFGPEDVPMPHPIPPLPLREEPTVAADGTAGTDLYLQEDKFRETFAADVDPATAAAMAVAQRPGNEILLTSKSAAAAWRTIPSWYLLTKEDHANSPDLQHFFAQRARAHTTEINSSHAVYVSHPDAVTRIIEQADRGTR
ncbi:alpha/beta hydrolase [Actinoplanes sp. RD1]|uniref:alpha/beta hydrolase n=1 Tax=Actinoplanes sp. RD1 TaxID=3064538 RepID=UPI0027404702|nr:alpha/beta hydrolase [Actinoplanes sp. RD1]